MQLSDWKESEKWDEVKWGEVPEEWDAIRRDLDRLKHQA